MRPCAATALATLLCLAPGPSIAAERPPGPPALAEIETAARAAVEDRLEEYAIPGAVVAIVLGDEVALFGAGLADVERAVPMDPERTVVRVGSVSKAVTSTAALIAVERGRLALDRDLRPLFAQLPLRPAWDAPLTLHHLLTHTGGFDEVLFGQHAATPDAYRPLPEFLRRELPPRFAPPGRVASYNDYGTSLIGYAIARATGQEFETWAERHLLRPLGMRDSTFHQVDLPGDLAARLARAWERRGGSWSAYERDYISTTPAAGLWTTAADMGRYLSALLDGARGGHPPLPTQRWRSQIQRRSAHHPQLPAWGYGFAQDRREGHEVWFKDGQASGFHARALVVPSLDLALFSASNRNIIAPGGDFHPAARFHRELGDELLGELFPAPRPPASEPSAAEPATPAPGAAGRIGRYVGTYRTTVQSRHTGERILAMFDEVRVTRAAEGGLSVFGSRWTEVEPGLFQHHRGGPHHLAFGGPEDGRPRYLFVARASYERVPAWSAARNTGRIAVALAALSAAGLVAGLILRWRRRDDARRRRRTATLLALHGGTGLAFFAAFATVFLTTDAQRFFHGPTPALHATVALPAVSLVLWLALAARLARGGGPGPAVERRWPVGLYLAASLPLYPWLAYWRLFGFWG